MIFNEEHVAGMQRAEDNGDVRKQYAARQGDDAHMSAKPFDGGEVECADAIDHSLMQCHAGCCPFFPLEFPVVE